MWLAHLVPISIGGRALGVMPLLPVLLMVGHRAQHCVGHPHSRQGLLGRRVGPGRLLLMAAIALAVIHDASSVVTDRRPAPCALFTSVLAVHSVVPRLRSG